MNVPKNILKYCDELAAKVVDEAAVLTQSDLSKWEECISWYMDYLEKEPVVYLDSLPDFLVENIAMRMRP